jgi:hypothetical protein
MVENVLIQKYIVNLLELGLNLLVLVNLIKWDKDVINVHLILIVKNVNMDIILIMITVFIFVNKSIKFHLLIILIAWWQKMEIVLIVIHVNKSIIYTIPLVLDRIWNVNCVLVIVYNVQIILV